jgi:hypothetical protein
MNMNTLNMDAIVQFNQGDSTNGERIEIIIIHLIKPKTKLCYISAMVFDLDWRHPQGMRWAVHVVQQLHHENATQLAAVSKF